MFYTEFSETLNQFVGKIAEGLQPAYKNSFNNDVLGKPRVTEIDEVASLLIRKTKIVILTGAGISVASGIPTFRGKGGFWTVKGKYINNINYYEN